MEKKYKNCLVAKTNRLQTHYLLYQQGWALTEISPFFVIENGKTNAEKRLKDIMEFGTINILSVSIVRTKK